MRTFPFVLMAFVLGSTPTFATVTVSSPTPNSTVTSPVHYVATASTSTCSSGVASMGVYVNNQLVYTVNGASLNTNISMASGNQHTVVEEWDKCGGASYTTVDLVVGTAPTSTKVTVTSPTPGSTVTSPVHYVATAQTATCAGGVSSMGVYVNNKLVYTVNGASLNTNISMAAGAEHTVVEEWDYCGGAAYTTVDLTVSSSTNPLPTVSISAQNSTITSGSSDTLTVSASNATSVVVKGSDGSSYTLANTGGTVSVKPSKTTTYTATATNASGSTTAQTTVTVSSSTSGLPTVSITASQSSISAGQSDTLTVTDSSTASLKVTGSDGSSYTLPYNGGTIAVKPSSTTTYTATATNGSGSTTASTTITVGAGTTTPTVSIAAQNSTISSGSSDTLTVKATNATSVVVTGSDGSSYTLASTGGTVTVKPSSTTTYTAEASNGSTTVSAQTTVTVTSTTPGTNPINHVIFMLQENHSFDNYFGMLNPYRHGNGWDMGDDGKTYTVDGIDDKLNTISNDDDEGTSYPLFKLRTTCIDDASSSWLESYGDVNRWDFSTTRTINMDGFVHIAEGFAKNCNANPSTCSGTFTDTTGERVMGYYDQDFLNWYYYMASQFAVSDRWFSPMSSKSIPNRIATFSGGTTQGLVFDPGTNDHLPQLTISNIFQELQSASVSWKIYYTVTQGGCKAGSACGTSSGNLPASTFLTFSYSNNFIYANPTHAACSGTTKPSSVWGDTSNYYCVDPNHIAPLSQYYTDVKNNTLPSFAFIESGSGLDDEHPGSGQSVLTGQSEVASIVGSLLTSPSWSTSAFFLAYDEGGGPYDHVPPVAGHSNDFTDSSMGTIPDISSIAVNADSYGPCLPSGGTPTTHCDLTSNVQPGGHSTDAATQYGFRAQLGFRVPNMVISPYTRKHYVSHVPMDHTAVIKFVENRFIGSSAHLTARDAAQPNLLDFFDFTAKPWSTPPTPPAPVTPSSLGYDPCEPTLMGP